MSTDYWLISMGERHIIDFYGADKAAMKQDLLAARKALEEVAESEGGGRDDDIRTLKAMVKLADDQMLLVDMTDDELVKALEQPKYLPYSDRPPVPMPPAMMLFCYREQQSHVESDRLEEPWQFWARAAQEALTRMPAIADRLRKEWQENTSYAAAVILALHAAPETPQFLSDAAKTDESIQVFLRDLETGRR